MKQINASREAAPGVSDGAPAGAATSQPHATGESPRPLPIAPLPAPLADQLAHRL
jgi:hypothetical protein